MRACPLLPAFVDPQQSEHVVLVNVYTRPVSLLALVLDLIISSHSSASIDSASAKIILNRAAKAKFLEQIYADSSSIWSKNNPTDAENTLLKQIINVWRLCCGSLSKANRKNSCLCW